MSESASKRSMFSATSNGKYKLEVEQSTPVWVATTVVVVMMVVWSLASVVHRMREKFHPTTSGWLGTQAHCLDTPGNERCGSGEAKRVGFLSSRAGGPDVGRSEPDLDKYYSEAIREPGSDTDPSADAPKPALLPRATTHSEDHLENVARGTH